MDYKESELKSPDAARTEDDADHSGPLGLLDEDNTATSASSPSLRPLTRPSLQSTATTAVSLADITPQGYSDNNKETYSALLGRNLASRGLKAKASLNQLASARASEAGDNASIRSFLPNAGEEESIFGDFGPTEPEGESPGHAGLLSLPEFQADDVDDDFAGEFEPIGELEEGGQNEGSYH